MVSSARRGSNERSGSDHVTNRGRALSLLVFMGIVLLARSAHAEFRAPTPGGEGLLWYLVLAMIFAAVGAVQDTPRRTARISVAVANATSASLISFGLAASLLIVAPNSLPRFSVLLSSLLLLIWHLIAGVAIAMWTFRNGQPDHVVAVVPERDAVSIEADGKGARQAAPFVVSATLSSESDYGRISEICAETAATVLVLGPKSILSPDVIRQAEALHRTGVKVRSLEHFYDERLGKLPLSSLDSFALLGDVESLHGGYAPLKRVIDIAFGCIGGLALLALLPFILVGNAIANRGPLFFRQQRVGTFGTTFDIIKLRTMTPGAVDVSGWTSNNDPRITGFGKLLRRTHIDELPQVLNIFVGDLSLVGPRPEQVTYVRQLEQSLPFYSARHLVRPGLTGWAQVRYPYAASEEDAFVKLQYDLHYLRHESLTTDLRIIGLTLRHVLTDGGR